MSRGAMRLRQTIGSGRATLAAPIFDPLSARIAEMRDWRICKLSGSVAKGAELALPDDVAITNMSDLVDICRRIVRAADVSVIVDADDGGSGPLAVQRTVRELEAVGVAAIEIEDNKVPAYYGEAESRHSLVIPIEEQVGRLRAAVAARRDESTLIVARTTTIRKVTLDEGLKRVAAYSKSGVHAINLTGLDHGGSDGRTEVEAVHGITDLPIFALGLSIELQRDDRFLDENGVRVIYSRGFPAYRMAAKGIDDAFAHLLARGDPAELSDRMVPMEFIREAPDSITRTAYFQELDAGFRS